MRLRERGKVTIAAAACVAACIVFGNYWTAMVIAVVGGIGMAAGALYE